MKILYTIFFIAFVFITSYSHESDNTFRISQKDDKTTIYFVDDLSITMSTFFYNEIKDSGKSNGILEQINEQLIGLKRLKHDIELNKNNPSYNMAEMQQLLKETEERVNFYKK